MTRARAIPPPRDCALVDLYPGADLVDAFAVPLPPGAPDIDNSTKRSIRWSLR